MIGNLSGDDDSTSMVLSFSTVFLGAAIQPGFYPNAQRAGTLTPGAPGLELAFQSRGCNFLNGSFTITDATFGPGPVIESFSASFEQRCDIRQTLLSGTFSYTAVPEPGPAVLLAAVAAAICRQRHRPRG